MESDDIKAQAPPIHEMTREEYLQEQLAQQLNLPALADTSAPPAPHTNKVCIEQNIFNFEQLGSSSKISST